MTFLETGLSFIQGCVHGMPLSYGLIFGLFLAGLAGSVGHCTLMCGPFVLSQAGAFEKLSGALLLPYHLGRITTYIFLAAVFYGAVSLVKIVAPLQVFVVAPLLMVAGVMFLLSAYPRLWAFVPLGHLLHVRTLELPKSVRGGVQGQKGVGALYAYGVMLGFIPCGMVFAAMMAAATADTLLQGMVAMAAFGLGTMPALMLVAVYGSRSKVLSPRATKVIQQTAYTWTGLWMVFMGSKLLLTTA